MGKTSIRKAVTINFISKYSNIIVQLILNSILARLLTPNDYGIVAIITVFINFFTVIADMGVGPAIIQKKELSRDEISDIFSFTFYISIVIAILFIIFSFPLSKIYNNNIYVSLSCILSVGILFSILNMVPNALMYKNKRFRELGIRTVLITIISGIITVILALYGAKYYALVINSTLSFFVTFLWNYISVDLKFKLKFEKSSIFKIREFSSFQFAFNLINYFSRNLDNLLVGKNMGDSFLGYYDKAYKLMLYPVSNLTHVITPVLHPILSEYQNDRERIYNEYAKVVKILALLGAFFSVFCFFSAKEIIIIMFGSNWLNSIPSFKILSLSICIQMVLSSSGTIFQSTNETKRLFLAGALGAIANIGGIIIGVILGKIEFVAWGVTIAYIINFMTGYYILIKKVFNNSLIKFLLKFTSTLIIIIVCSISMYLFNKSIDNVLLSITYKLAICSISYIIGIFITREDKFFFNMIKRR